MTALTHKQRVKVNAALASIHAHGHDASAVTGLAKQLQASGHDARSSFEFALNRFADSNPDMGDMLGKITRLVEASDAATVHWYDQALGHYNQTGDDSGISALAPMIAQDSVALAIRSGEMSEADLATDGLETALGFAPSDAMVHAATAAPAPAPAQRASFSFRAPPPGAPSAPRSFVNGTQHGAVGTTGIKAPKTGAALAREVGVPMAYAVAQGWVAQPEG
jgi:hypothetical protein